MERGIGFIVPSVNLIKSSDTSLSRPSVNERNLKKGLRAHTAIYSLFAPFCAVKFSKPGLLLSPRFPLYFPRAGN